MIRTHSVDLLLLAECAEEPGDVLAELNRKGPYPFSFAAPYAGTAKVQVFFRDGFCRVIPKFNDPAGVASIYRLLLPGLPELILVAVHFPSKVNYDRDDQTLTAPNLMRDVRREEGKLFHKRTILVGDLNMNPYDPGMVGAQALHGMLTRDLARQEQRTIGGRTYDYFYNPMWGFLGDRTPGPPGTHFFGGAKPINTFWQMYDQVLLRPSLMNKLATLQILDSDGEETLLTRNGRPKVSDHLPLHFTLNL